jgi:UDP-2,3-diacylglucosamine pyrophosphatase LpxH
MRFVQAVLPNQAVRALGEWMSEKSRNQTGRDAKVAAPILSIIRRHATKAHGERAFDFLIAGHVHVQDWYELKVQGNRGPHVPVAINLGTWLDAPVVLELTDSGAQWIKEHSAFGNSHR